MKRLIVFVVLIACAAFYFYLEHDKPEIKRVIRVGVECAYAPNNWEESKPSKSDFPLANHPGFYAKRRHQINNGQGETKNYEQSYSASVGDTITT